MEITDQIRRLIDKLNETPEIKQAIVQQLLRQHDVKIGFVKLDTGEIVKEGEDE